MGIICNHSLMFILLMFASLFTSATSVVTLADIPSLKAVYD